MNQQAQHELEDALVAVMGDMQQAVDRFAQALESERQALDAGDSEALDLAGADKQATVLQLEQLDAERRQLLEAQPSSATAIDAMWTDIVQALQRCHRLNQRNGAVVNQRLGLVRQALAVLTGQPGDTELYGPSGTLHANLRSKIFAAV